MIPKMFQPLKFDCTYFLCQAKFLANILIFYFSEKISTFHVNHLLGISLNINLCKRLILKALSKSVAEDILNFFYNFSVFLKIRLGISCECSASLTFSEKYEKKNQNVCCRCGKLFNTQNSG